MVSPYDVYGTVIGDQQTVLQNQNLMDQHTLRQQEIQSNIAAGERQKAISSLLSQQPAPSLTQQQSIGDVTPEVNNLQQSSKRLLDAGNKIMSLDPKLGNQFITQARELEDTSIGLRRQQLAEQKDTLAHIASWAGTIHSQPELDAAKQVVESRHPGTWASMKLPETYDQTTAPKFQQLALSSSTALQQAEIAFKQIETQTAGRYFEAKAQKAELDVVKERQDIALAREKLSKQKTATTAYDKYQNELLKETNQYETQLQKDRQAILKDTKKYPPVAPDYSPKEKIWASTFGDPLPPKESPRDVALKQVEQEAARAHQARVAAIEAKASALGVNIPKKPGAATPAPNSYEIGKIYVDANGNKAKWNGSDWEPQ